MCATSPNLYQPKSSLIVTTITLESLDKYGMLTNSCIIDLSSQILGNFPGFSIKTNHHIPKLKSSF
jgi:hypothetical protein